MLTSACGSSTTTNDGGVPDGASPDSGAELDNSVLTRNHHTNRDGVFTQPALTKAAVAGKG